MGRLTTLTALLLSAVACAPPAVDLDAERAALLEADRAWAAAYAAADNPADAFTAQLVDDAYFLAPEAPLARGKDAVHGMVTELEGMPGFTITWGPTAAEVGSGGGMGFTIGTYQMQMEGPDGPMSIDGKYMTVWQKQTDGSWKVIADMFNADGPPR